jgi:putative heme-binding domain-containing protein
LPKKHARVGNFGVLRLIPWLVCAAAVVAAASLVNMAAEPNAPNQTAIEALKRLKDIDLESNPALKAAVLRVLDGTRGTAQFVEIVRDFGLGGQANGLLEVLRTSSHEETAAEAMRLLLHEGKGDAILALIDEADPASQETLVRALGNAGEHSLPFLAELLCEPTVAPASRTAAIRALARTEPGAKIILQLARDGALDDAGRLTASLSLAQSRWPHIRAEAGAILPVPRSGDGEPVPPLPELLKLRGDPERGAAVFRSDSAACIKCHVVGGEGIDFGPALTQIGTKLGRQALYESILDPSAGIAFGYEGWSIATIDGEEVFGIISSETPDELAVKQQTGVIMRLRKGEILSRQRQRLSVMPAGLAQLVSRRDLVDLVEYLTTLKAPGG